MKRIWKANFHVCLLLKNTGYEISENAIGKYREILQISKTTASFTRFFISIRLVPTRRMRNVWKVTEVKINPKI